MLEHSFIRGARSKYQIGVAKSLLQMASQFAKWVDFSRKTEHMDRTKTQKSRVEASTRPKTTQDSPLPIDLRIKN